VTAVSRAMTAAINREGLAALTKDTKRRSKIELHGGLHDARIAG